ncbi:MAG TPA: excinuclease ABC subunit UvrB [Candidatus Paceibacterota bacterium]|nr:excinuclease ABC subunit UvrB [Candidatus Paceibacterota bacterium]
MNNKFKLISKHAPAGDQPQAIESLVSGIKKSYQHQTLLGVTGSGKTFTVANVIEKIQKPTLVIAHNKTLAAQLAQEFRELFPENAVHYFVSYYDYYQPEAYKPTTDTYIEKEAMINEEIDRLRHASTQALLTRKDVIIVASVSCIYGLGSPEEYNSVNYRIEVDTEISRNDFIRKLIDIHYERTNADLNSGTFRAIGETVEIIPVSERFIVEVKFDGDKISSIQKIDNISRSLIEKNLKFFYIFPAKHFIANSEITKKAIKTISTELEERLLELKKEGKILEAERLKRRTRYDISMIREIGYCNGIENYSRHFENRAENEAPNTLLSYFPHKKELVKHEKTGEVREILTPDFLTIIDESHVTVPQIGGMYAGDQSRKNTLIEHGFRLPSARDNRPLRFNEFEHRVGQVIYTSATPSDYEKNHSQNIVEQIIRPTGLVDPMIEIVPIVEKGKHGGQVKHFISQSEKEIKKGGRVIATTLTKKMAEDLSLYLKDKKIKAEYLHSEIKTIERIEILTKFRRGEFDILVGVNLLREGLDLPEVTLIGILDADKEGFLRSETALIQTIGRAARNVDGRVILYADNITGSMERAIGETNRRRELQLAYNKKHGITPKTIIKAIRDITDQINTEHKKAVNMLLKLDDKMLKNNPQKLLKQKEKKMNAAAKNLDFETAAILRDEIKYILDILNKDGKVSGGAE